MTLLGGTGVSIDSEYLKMSQSVKSKSEMDKDTFINLLCTQMQYQDPLNPMDNSEMVAQLAQFSALEQMMNVAQVSQKQLANTMVGQYVEYYFEDQTTGSTGYSYGKVDYVDLSGSVPTLGIGNLKVELEDIYAIIDKDNIQANTTAYDLIDKTVQATIVEMNESGEEETYTVEGKVSGVSLKEGIAYVVIGKGEEKVTAAFSNVTSVVEKVSITGRKVTAHIPGDNNQMQTIEGIAEYIKIDSKGKYQVCVQGQFIDYEDIVTVE